MISFFSSPIERPDPESLVWRSRVSFSGSEAFFVDHFPGYPLVPGVLLLERMRWVAENALQESGVRVRLTETSKVRFLKPVIPPSDLQATLIFKPEDSLTVKGELWNVDREKVATASFLFEPLEGVE